MDKKKQLAKYAQLKQDIIGDGVKESKLDALEKMWLELKGGSNTSTVANRIINLPEFLHKYEYDTNPDLWYNISGDGEDGLSRNPKFNKLSYCRFYQECLIKMAENKDLLWDKTNKKLMVRDGLGVINNYTSTDVLKVLGGPSKGHSSCNCYLISLDGVSDTYHVYEKDMSVNDIISAALGPEIDINTLPIIYLIPGEDKIRIPLIYVYYTETSFTLDQVRILHFQGIDFVNSDLGSEATSLESRDFKEGFLYIYLLNPLTGYFDETELELASYGD